jgi:hypothetical protein
MSTKPRLIEMNVLKKVIKNNKIEVEDSVVNSLFKYTGGGLVHIVKNYSDFIFLILFLFIVLYLRYKFNKSTKKSSNLASKEIEINYIRNQDIVNNQIVSINDDIKSDHQFDDNILNRVKKEINLIENDSLQPINFGTEYSSY